MSAALEVIPVGEL